MIENQNYKRLFAIVIIAFLFAIASYSLAQIAQDTADIANNTANNINLSNVTIQNSSIQINESQVTNLQTDLNAKVNKSGDTMTGSLNINVGSSTKIGDFFTSNNNANELFLGKAESSGSSMVLGFNPANNYGYIQVYGVSPGGGIVLGNSGNVGIGTPTTTRKLTVQSGAISSISDFFSTNANSNEIFIGQSESSDSTLVIGYNKTSNKGYIQIFGDAPLSSLYFLNGGSIGSGSLSGTGTVAVCADSNGQLIRSTNVTSGYLTC